MSASTYILCAFQDHLHPRAAAVAHVHDAHTHTDTDLSTLAPGEAQLFTQSAHSRRYPLHLERGLPLHAWPLFLLFFYLQYQSPSASTFYELRNVQFLLCDRLFTSFP